MPNELRDGALQRWWPTTQALDLIEAPPTEVAAALSSELRRIVPAEPLQERWLSCADLDAAFASVRDLTNVPTTFLVLPTHTRWCVVWNNSFLCDGYDSLCHNLTRLHGLVTVHWSAHDTPTTFQAGARFCLRRREGDAMRERSVAVACTDGRWSFHSSGEPLPEEDLGGYGARRVRDRLDERRVMQLLERLGASPWRESFYALASTPCFALTRPRPPDTVSRRPVAAVLRPEA